MFAGCCIGVICLVVTLEFLRRVQREYNKFLAAGSRKAAPASLLAGKRLGAKTRAKSSTQEHSPDSGSSGTERVLRRRSANIRPAVLQHAIRATIHMLQFAVAYFIMLLAMYYNGMLLFKLSHPMLL